MPMHQAFHAKRQEGSTEARIALATEEMTRALGRNDPDDLARAVDRELNRTVAKAVFDQLARDGISVKGLKVLDCGAGLGAVSVEAAMRGAQITALEPGQESAAICDLRLDGLGETVCASGERLPFEDSSFDLVVSIQVLEHVENPRAYLAEAFRVLRPGGHLYLSCENYLAFREPHYNVPWLPLMPKGLGRMWLRMLCRPTGFLTHSVFYTTTPGTVRMVKRCGFKLVRELQARAKWGGLAPWVVRWGYWKRMFSAGTYVLAVK